MRVLKMDLLGTPAVGDLVEHDLGDLHSCAANPGDVAAIKFNSCSEHGSHWRSSGTSIREGRTSREAVEPSGPVTLPIPFPPAPPPLDLNPVGRAPAPPRLTTA